MLVEDHSIFMADFGVNATLAGQAVRGIFDNGFLLGDVGMAGMAGSAPVLTLPTASVPAVPVGAAAVINGVSYVVAAHEFDGTGMSRLLLERA